MAEIRHELTIKRPPESLFRALVEPGGLAGWWTADVEAEARVGSVASFGFGKHSTVLQMRVDALEPDSEVRWHCLDGLPEWQGTDLSFTLEPTDEGTRLRFLHAGWATSDGIQGICSYDWARYLGSLKQLIETGRGTPNQA